jgi:hypothetical protein
MGSSCLVLSRAVAKALYCCWKRLDTAVKGLSSSICKQGRGCEWGPCGQPWGSRWGFNVQGCVCVGSLAVYRQDTALFLSNL